MRAVDVMVASSSPPPSGPTVSSIVDSPASGDLGALPEIAFGAQTTLGYSDWVGGKISVADGMQNANIALLGNYMASSFAMTSDGHGGTLVVGGTDLGHESRAGGCADAWCRAAGVR